MALERWFRRKRPTRADDDPSPAGLWLKCEDCSAQIYRKDVALLLPTKSPNPLAKGGLSCKCQGEGLGFLIFFFL